MKKVRIYKEDYSGYEWMVICEDLGVDTSSEVLELKVSEANIIE